MRRWAALIVLAAVGLTGCGGGGSAARDKCEATAGVGRCLHRHGKWVAVGSVTATTSTTEPTTTALPAPATTVAVASVPPTTASTVLRTTTTRAPTTTRPPTTSTTVAVRHNLDGQVILALSGSARSCGPPDVVPPAQVVIKDANGAIITVARVGSPYRTHSGQYAFCTYPFNAELADSPAYTFQADDEKPVTVGKDELERNGWKITLTEYTS